MSLIGSTAVFAFKHLLSLAHAILNIIYCQRVKYKLSQILAIWFFISHLSSFPILPPTQRNTPILK